MGRKPGSAGDSSHGLMRADGPWDAGDGAAAAARADIEHQSQAGSCDSWEHTTGQLSAANTVCISCGWMTPRGSGIRNEKEG